MKLAVMRFSVVPLTFIFIMISFISSYAYSDNFTKINNEEGLSQNTIQCMIQDKLGFIWVGTNDGLNRYNGYEFKIYKHDKKNPDSIAGNNIIDLLEDENDNIWIATSNGLSKINTINNEVINYSNKKESGNLSYYMITDILLTSNGKILVATFDGLNLYNEKTDSFERILGDDSLISQTIYSIEEDIYGEIWIATSKGISRIDNNNKIYNYPTILNGETGEISSGKSIFKIKCDDQGYIWASTFKYGVYKINLKDYSFIKYTNDENDDTSLPGNSVRDVLRDENNQVWVATNNGLASYNEKDEIFTTYSKKSYDSKSISQNEVHSLMQDKSGIIWVGTYSGINIFDPNIKIEHYKNNPLDKNSISESIVTTIYEDKYKYLWVGTYSNGINLINRDTGEIIRLGSEGDYNFIVSDYINYITGYKDEIYVATDYGLNIINTNTKESFTYTENNGLVENNIKNLFVDSSGNLWIGSANGVTLLKHNNKEIIDITSYIKENRNLNLYTKCIYEDKSGAIWIGFGLSGGLVKIENEDGRYNFTNYMHSDNKNSIISDTIRAITEDGLGNLWIGTDYGLSKLNLKTNKFTNYTKDDGLSSNVVNGLLIDDNNNPWISSNKGISKFDINKNSFENFNTTDGLQGDEYYLNSYFKSSKGELLFGGTNGLDIFYPEDIEKSNYMPSLVFEEFEVNGKKIDELNNTKLNHNQSEIRVKMFLPDYRNSSNTIYYYKLNNLRDYNDNKKWLSTKSNEMNYSGLSPGKYEIRIKAMNHNGEMSEEKIINFIIKPPFWKSPIAIIIYISLAIILIYYIINHVKYLDNLVKTRTMDLAKEIYANNELLTKVIALEKHKNDYFVNLSHELRTPLNVICTSEQLITSINNSDKGLERDKLNAYMDVIRKNANRLLDLINNLIDGSKIENGNYKINLEDNDIVYIVEEAALSLKDYIQSKNIELIVDPEIEEKIIKCDAYEIERCIINLVSNAYKFTPSGGTIEVNIRDLGDKTEINVIDTGIGIESKYHDIIFDRFNQVLDSPSEAKGSGLGLTITKQIIQLHGGTISLESEIGKGSKFTIIL